MPPEQARLRRLLRLEKVRAIAMQTAAAEAAHAESTLSQLQALADRTRLLADDYGGRAGATDAAALQQLGRFAGGLRGIAATTLGDVARARGLADTKQVALGQAERRRAAVEDRANEQARLIARGGDTQALGTRKGFGTDVE